LPRKTDSNNPADWLWIAESYLEALRLICERQVGYQLCRSKLAEVLEKMIKAELIRNGWSLEKTHDLEKLLDHLKAQASDLVGVAEPLCDALGELYFIDTAIPASTWRIRIGRRCGNKSRASRGCFL